MIHEWEDAFSYQGFSPTIIRKEALRKCNDDLTPICKLLTLVLQRGTSSTKITRRMSDRGKEIFRSVSDRLDIKTTLATITLGRLMAAFPEVAMYIIARANSKPSHFDGGLNLPAELQFPSAISLIPTTFAGLISEHYAWTVQFTKKITKPQNAEKTKTSQERMISFWTLVKDSQMFTDELRMEMMMKMQVEDCNTSERCSELLTEAGSLPEYFQSITTRRPFKRLRLQ